MSDASMSENTSGHDIGLLAARLRKLEDERDIRLALDRYGHSIDYGLESEWVDCFTPDGVYDLRLRVMSPGLDKIFPFARVDAGGIRFSGSKALASFVAVHSRPPAAYHKHIVVDQIVTRFGEEDKARATSYFLRVDDLAGRREIVAFGRYVDLLVRCPDGRWRFSERVVELESSSIAPPPAEVPHRSISCPAGGEGGTARADTGANRRAAGLDVGRLLDRARAASGLSDFGDPWFIEPLTQLVAMINAEAGLISDDEPPVQAMVKNLADRLQLVDYLKRHPAALEEHVKVGGIIIGLGRGGSTLLHRLLSTSSRLNHTPWWEVAFPLPLPGESPGDPTPRIELGKRAATRINEVWPEMVAMHPVDALEADEEIALLDRTPLCLMYSFYFNIPSYMPWLRRQDHRHAYEELKTWLKVLQHQTPSRRGRKWLLKSGHHLHAGGLRVMLDTFPEAKSIMTHRTLQNVIVSYCSLQAVTVRNYSSTFDAKRLGGQAIDVFREAIKNLIAVRAEYPAERFFDVQYEDTVKRPLEVYRRTMEAMDIEVSAADERAAQAWMAGHGRDTHPPHVYAPEDYGTTREEIAQALDFYHRAFLRTA